jgi:hypothetical protein
VAALGREECKNVEIAVPAENRSRLLRLGNDPDGQYNINIVDF